MKAKLIHHHAAPGGYFVLTFQPAKGPHSMLAGTAEDFPGIGPEHVGREFEIVPPFLYEDRGALSPVEAGSPPAEPPPGGWPQGTIIGTAGNPRPESGFDDPDTKTANASNPE